MGRPILSPGKKLTGEKTDRYTGISAVFPVNRVFPVNLGTPIFYIKIEPLQQVFSSFMQLFINL